MTIKPIVKDGSQPFFIKQSKRQLEEDLSPEDYQAILDIEMPSEELNCIPVYTTRGTKLRPDDKAKTEYCEWENLPELTYD